MQLLAQSITGQPINDKDHEPDHTPTFHWTDADIDKSINTRVANANKPKAQAKKKQNNPINTNLGAYHAKRLYPKTPSEVYDQSVL